MFDFIQRFFGKPSSSATAKERLRLVLLSDHLSLAPDVVEALKTDLVEVISRYVEVDVANCDVTFEQRENEVAMLANIPILGMRKRPTPPSPPPLAPQAEPPSLDAAGATATLAEPLPPKPAAVPAPKPSTNGHRSRRKRRKALATNTAPQAT